MRPRQWSTRASAGGSMQQAWTERRGKWPDRKDIAFIPMLRLQFSEQDVEEHGRSCLLGPSPPSPPSPCGEWSDKESSLGSLVGQTLFAPHFTPLQRLQLRLTLGLRGGSIDQPFFPSQSDIFVRRRQSATIDLRLHRFFSSSAAVVLAPVLWLYKTATQRSAVRALHCPRQSIFWFSRSVTPHPPQPNASVPTMHPTCIGDIEVAV